MLRMDMLIRKATDSDIGILNRIADEMGASHEAGYFKRCLDEQKKAKRTIFIGEEDGKPVGYAQLIWSPNYLPFRRLGIPEIQDLNVVAAFRQRGFGGLLVDHCEKAARDAGKTDIGISVGLYPRYGAAQRLYVKKGYLPDGSGISYDEIPVTAGEMRPVDDFLTLKLVKEL